MRKREVLEGSSWLAAARAVDVAYECSALLRWIELIEEDHRDEKTIHLSAWEAERLFALAGKVRDAYGH